MSASAASSRWAAILVAFAFTRRAASSTEPPATTAPRQPAARGLARLPRPQSGVVRTLQHARAPVGVAAAVEFPAAGAPVRKRLRPDEVSPAHLGRIEREPRRRDVEQALHHERRLLLPE